jgi:hypothetical protein
MTMHALDQGVIHMTATGVHRQTGRLVHGHAIGILVENIEFAGGAFGRGQLLLGRDKHNHPRAVAHAATGAALAGEFAGALRQGWRRGINQDETVLDQALDRSPRAPREVTPEKSIETQLNFFNTLAKCAGTDLQVHPVGRNI